MRGERFEMARRPFRRSLSLLAALAFLPCAGLRGESSPRGQEATGAENGPRYGQVFDVSQDGGRLVARFLKLRTGAVDADKAGDSTILTSPDGLTMLIDGGETDCGPQVVADLRAMGVKKLDIVVASHPHVDHIGGLPAVLDAFPVGVLYMSRVEYPTGPYARLLEAIKRNKVPLSYLAEGDSFAFGAEVTAKVYNPEREIKYYEGYPRNSTAFLNDHSLVIRLSYGAASMLFMGDIYTSRELDLMERYGEALKSDVIKVGHHGNETSSSKSFIRLVAPKYACIINDSLDSVKVYNNYRKLGAAVFVTFVDGSVRLGADRDGNYSVLTEQDRQSDFLK